MNCPHLEASQCRQYKCAVQSKGVKKPVGSSRAPRMDVTLFREDEQFVFKNYGSPYVYSKGYSSHSKDDDIDDMFTEVCPMPKPPMQIFEWEEPEIPRPQPKIQSQDFVQTIELPVLNGNAVLPDNAVAQLIKQEVNLVEDILAFDNLDPSIQNALRIKAEDIPALKKGRTPSCSSDLLNTSFSSTDLAAFDITDYVFKDEQPQSKDTVQIKTEEIHIKSESVPSGKGSGGAEDVKPIAKSPIKKAMGIGRKKIDFKARRYIVENPSEDEDEVDIETVSDSAPVLEAGNIDDLLTQFEATEACLKQENPPKVETKTEKVIDKKFLLKQENPPKVEIKTEKVIDKKSVIAKPLKQEPKAQKRKLEQASCNDAKRAKKVEEPSNQSIKDQKVVTEKKAIPQVANVMAKQSSNKQIVNSLPQELINRIKKESGKRKPITVIEAIPNIKKRGGAKVQQEATIKAKPASSQNTVILDHAYCMTNNACENTVKKLQSQSISNQKNKNPTNLVKDSGFASPEDNDNTVISMQPTVKNADGTLMVSLLKTNTIHKVESAQANRKKLNLEEYKKRRSAPATPKSNSQGCSPIPSTCSSPAPEEDEHQKMLRHQEKLRKMAHELLKTAPKSEQKRPEIDLKVPSFGIKSPQPPPEKEMEPPKLPPNLECKVFVNFGTNTDFRISKNQRDPLAPVAKLQEIKPLIDHVVKNNENSLISSVMETIPKLIEQSERPNQTMPKAEPDEEHGEFKRIVYLKKDRARAPTREIATQTNVSLIEQSKVGKVRRRSSSTSSSRRSRGSSPRSGNSSASSVSSRSSLSSYSSRPSPYCSRSSDYSSRTSSRLSFETSRSRSPAYSRRSRNSNADEDHLNAVEERRIIYVGRISRNTTKDDLHRKFRKFGPINKVSLHFRDIGYSHMENYGFVTFQYKEDAHAAYEHGNDDPAYPYYKISFGGRREFCKAAYSDLDDVRDVRDVNYYQYAQSDDSYDRLLKDTLAKLKKRKA